MQLLDWMGSWFGGQSAGDADSESINPIPKPEPGETEGPWPNQITPLKVIESVKAGYEAMEWVRSRRRDVMRSLVGPQYGHSSRVRARDSQRTPFEPINLTFQQVTSLLPSVVPVGGNQVKARFADLDFDAEMLKAALDDDDERLRVRDRDVACFIDAVAGGLSVVRSGLRLGPDAMATDDGAANMGELFETEIDLDDYTTDHTARRWSQRSWDAVRYTATREDLIGFFGKPDLSDDPMQPGYAHPNLATPEEADAMIRKALSDARKTGTGQARVSDLGGVIGPGAEPGRDKVVERIELWDFFAYRGGECFIFTMVSNATADYPDGDKFLAVRKWRGMGESPLSVLSFIPLPGLLMPLSLAQTQRELAVVVDLLANKMIHQTLNTKQNTIFAPAARDTMMAVKRSAEDEAIEGDPTKIRTVKTGGLIPEVWAGLQGLIGLWSDKGGGLRQASGLDGGDDTATAFAGRMGQVRGWLAFLRSRMDDFRSERLRHRAFFRITDPRFSIVRPLILESGDTINIRYDQSIRNGDFDSFNFQVESTSTEDMDPRQRARTLIEVLQGPVPALMQMVAQGLMTPDGAYAVMCDLARDLDLPSLHKIIPDAKRMASMAQAYAIRGTLPTFTGQPQQQPATLSAGQMTQAAELQSQIAE